MVADPVRAAVADVRTGRHEGPESGRVLRATRVAGGVVEIRQAEVVRVLVREDAEAAVLGLDRVVADPDVSRVVRETTRETARGAAATGVDARVAVRAAAGDRGVPAVRPDRVRALMRVAGSLVATSVDDLEVVDEAVGLGEVSVAVRVVAVGDVERLEIRLDRRHRDAGVELTLDPDRHRVADQEPGVVADDPAAEIAAVAGLVERHLDPAVDVTGDRVAVRGLMLEVRRHPVEVHVLVVGLGVLVLPERRVVDDAIRRVDLVVERPVVALRAAVGWEGTRLAGIAERGVACVPELGDDHEDAIGALARELDELPVRRVHLAVGLALDLVLQRDLQRRVVLLLHRATKVVLRPLVPPLALGLALIRHGGRRQRKGEERNRECA